MKLKNPISRFGVTLFAGLALASSSFAGVVFGSPSYNPQLKNMQGLALPVVATALPDPNFPINPYTLAIKSPTGLDYSKGVTVSVIFAIAPYVVGGVSLPPGGNATTARSYVSAHPSTLTFTAENQTKTTVISVNIPAAQAQTAVLGDYGYLITETWPTGVVDAGATINMTVLPAPRAPVPPTITIISPVDGSTWIYDPTVAAGTTGYPPFTVSFNADVIGGAATDTITGLDASLSAGSMNYGFDGSQVYPSGEKMNALQTTFSTDSLHATGTVTSPAIIDGGPHTITVTAFSYSTPSVTATTTINILTLPKITNTDNPSFTYGQAGSYTVTSRTCYPVATFSAATALPAGLSIDPNYGVISGTPTAAGTYSVTVTASNVYPAPPATATFHGSDSHLFSLTVAPATLTVTASSATRVYDTANPSSFTATVSSGFVNGDKDAVLSGAAAVGTTATSTSPVGSYSITASLGSLSASNYTFVFVPGTLTVTQATPTITWTNPASITYGTALSATQLNASPSVAGVLTYTPASGVVLTAGTQTLNVSFVPTDTTNYKSPVTASVSLVVNKAKPTITWTAPASITYGTPLSATQLNATASVPGAFTYTPAVGAVLNAGANQTLSVSFIPTDTTDYTSPVTASELLTVTAATPVLSWATPAAITYGTALTSAAQLNATATFGGTSVAGTFIYSQNAGTVLAAGNQTLTVNFTPTSTNYSSPLSSSVTLVVNKAPLTVTANNATIAAGSALPTFTATFAGLVNNDASTVVGTLSFATTATTTSAAGTYPITVSGTTNPGNYTTVNYVPGTLTVTAASTLPTCGTAIVRHEPELNGNSGVDGSLQVLLPENIALNGNAWISENLFVVGTPTVKLNGHPIVGAISDTGGGSASPSNYTITLNGNAALGKLVRQKDAVGIQSVTVAPATGKQDVKINRSGDIPSNFSNVRDLTVNGNAGSVAVPAGAYRDFTVTGNSGLILGVQVGVQDSTPPSVYNVRSLKFTGNSTLTIVGPVVLNVANDVNFGGDVGNSSHPEWLSLKLASGDLTVDGTLSVYAFVQAPAGEVTINGQGTLTGGLICDRLTMNGWGLVDLCNGSKSPSGWNDDDDDDNNNDNNHNNDNGGNHNNDNGGNHNNDNGGNHNNDNGGNHNNDNGGNSCSSGGGH